MKPGVARLQAIPDGGDDRPLRVGEEVVQTPRSEPWQWGVIIELRTWSGLRRSYPNRPGVYHHDVPRARVHWTHRGRDRHPNKRPARYATSWVDLANLRRPEEVPYIMQEEPGTGRCTACQTKIVFRAHVTTGRTAPINAEPSETGNVAVLDNGRWRLIGKTEDYRGPRYVSHFATCPAATKFRKDR